MRVGLAALVISLVAGCGDLDPAGPLPPPGADGATNGGFDPAVRDAFDRILPGLDASPAALELSTTIADAVTNRGHISIRAIEATLNRLLAEHPEAAAEADAIRLAIMTRP